MSQLWNTCRVCHKASFEPGAQQGMLRYGVRHWAHVQCGIDRFGAEAFFRKLSASQIQELPWKIAETYHAELVAAHPEAIVESK